MIADRHEIAAVRRNGEGELHITVGAKPVAGQVCALQPAVGRPARCHAKVEDVWDHREGGWVVLVTLTAKEIPPRYLTAKGTSYTTDPAQAARDPETGAAEWAPPADWVDEGAETRDRVREQYRREQEADQIARLLPDVETWDDLVRIKQHARARGIEIDDDLEAVEARIEALRQRLRKGGGDGGESR